MRFRLLAATLAVGLLTVLGSSAGATTYVPPTPSFPPDVVSYVPDTSPVDATFSTTTAQTKTFNTTDAECVAVMKANAKPTAPCAVVTELAVAAETAPSATDLATMKASGAQLAAAASFTIRCKTWSQTMRAATGIWGEKHLGKMCYGGGDVYVFNPWGGYHNCDLGWGIGWDVVVKYCNPIIKVYDSSFYGGYFRQNWDRFKIYYGLNGSPVNFSKNMHANVFPSGTITFHHS